MRRMMTVRKPNISILLILTLVFAAFVLGFSLGRGQNRSDIRVTVSQVSVTAPTETEHTDPLPSSPKAVFPICINTASQEEIAQLPGIGDTLAKRIVRYRRLHGRFSRPEDLLKVEGIGEKRLEEMIDLIVIGG